ncbi:F-box/LRR-repeat protein 7-like isoform X2 [Lineus longissimus]|uniref:F-box/LRR-repeat protein 7-like isoform X2 n=1 Tax=Lineus longissimus TaxID=88925 RepID=UPI002B4CB766
MAQSVDRGRVFTDWDGMMAELFDIDDIQISQTESQHDTTSSGVQSDISPDPPRNVTFRPQTNHSSDRRSDRRSNCSSDYNEYTVTAVVHGVPNSTSTPPPPLGNDGTQMYPRSRVDVTLDSDSSSEPRGYQQKVRNRTQRHLQSSSETNGRTLRGDNHSLDSDSSSDPRLHSRVGRFKYQHRGQGSDFSDSSGDPRFTKVTFKNHVTFNNHVMETSFDSSCSDPARFISPMTSPLKSPGVPYYTSSPNCPIDPSSDYSSGNLSQTDLQETQTIMQLANLKKRQRKFNYFDLLPDDVIQRIFAYQSTDDKCRCARVCNRWFGLVWDPCLWSTIRISGDEVEVDKALKVITRRLSYDTPYLCMTVHSIVLNGCSRLTDTGLQYIAARCPELIKLEILGCHQITNWALFEIVSKCTNLEHLNVSACPSVTCISLTPEASMQSSPLRSKQILLRHLDLTDCHNLEDSGLTIITSHCTQLLFLYLRRCVKISDIGMQYIANFCPHLRELSICDCRKVTDFGLRELAKLETSLRYLSVAKCDKISDVGIKYIAKYCHRLRYMNARGCEAVSDDGVHYLVRSCGRLRSLDIGKCDITDDGLFSIAENCGQLRKLSVKSCEGISDQGIMAVACSRPQLEHLNIQDCPVSIEAYRAVKKFCKKCIIEHTNPGFY